MIPPALRRVLGQVKRSLDRRTLNEDQFRRLLADLGVARGATVLLHTSMNVLQKRVPTLSPIPLIRVLQESVGETGTLLMPTLPFSGLQKPYIDRRPVFDVRRTPSQSGLLTEVFRRLPGVLRSAHPVASVAAWGRHAAEVVGDHHRGASFGAMSPYGRLAALGGLEVGLGTASWATYSLLHHVEEMDPATHAYCFESDPVPLVTRDGESQIECPVVPLRADRERDFSTVEALLLSEGVVRVVTRGGLECRTSRADAFVRRGLELAREGRFLFAARPLTAGRTTEPLPTT